MSATEHQQVLAEIFPDEGERWHVVEGTSVVRDRHGHEWTQYHLRCGNKLVQHEIDDESDEGEAPNGLNGNTVCYGCAGGHK